MKGGYNFIKNYRIFSTKTNNNENTHLLTELTDMITGFGLGHGSDSKKWTGVSTKGLTQNVMSQVDLRGPHSLKFGQMHLYEVKKLHFLGLSY